MRSSIFISAIFFSVVACGPKPKAAAPASEATDKAAPAAETKPEAKPEATATEAPAEPPADHSEKPSRPPIDTITAPKMAFVINYGASAPNEKSEKKCDKAAGDNMQKRAQCMAKERQDFVADVLQFKADDKGQMWFITYRRKGSNLVVIGRTPIELTDEKDNSVVAKVAGKDKVARVLFAGRPKFEIKVPNDYSIEVDEPRYGKLVYDAKIDLLE